MTPLRPPTTDRIEHERHGAWLAQALPRAPLPPARLADRALSATWAQPRVSSFADAFFAVAARFLWGSTAVAVVAVLVLWRESSSTWTDGDSAVGDSAVGGNAPALGVQDVGKRDEEDLWSWDAWRTTSSEEGVFPLGPAPSSSPGEPSP